MEFMKRHGLKLILLIVFLTIFVVALYAVIKFFYPDSRKDVYGNRLLGIEDVQIDNQTITEIKDKISSSDFVLEVDYVLKGRLMNFTIYVNTGTDKNIAKNLVTNITELLSTEIQEFYDIQVLIIEDKEEKVEETEQTTEKKDYPIFAYKHKTSKEFVWTNN